MNVPVYSLEGKKIGEVELPAVFSSPLRPDLIKRAVLAEESFEKQPKSNYRFAGLETSAKYRGRKETYGAIKNRGIPHLPHEVLPKGRFGKVKRVPHAVKGRRAHPPKLHKKIHELINRKEHKNALASALAFSAHPSAVSQRMGVEIPSAPIVLEDAVESLKKTKDAVALMEKLGLKALLENAKQKGRKSALFVFKESNGAFARNIAGADAVRIEELLVKHLAPGTHPGRLLILSRSALEELGRRFEA